MLRTSPKRVDGVVDQNAVLEQERLAADRKAEIDGEESLLVQIGKQASEVALKEEGADVRVELVFDPVLFNGVAGKGVESVFVQGADAEDDLFGSRQLEVGEQVKTVHPFRGGRGDAVVEGLKRGP